MLNESIQQKILSVLQGYVLSTSMIARKTKLSRITVAKYLSAMESKHNVQALRIGKALAWRALESKPVVAIAASTGTARMVKLALGDRYSYLLTTSGTAVRDAFVLITDSPHYVKIASVPVILIGAEDERACTLPSLFDTRTLKVLVKKMLHEQQAPDVEAQAAIVLEHFDEFEEGVGIHRADELLKLTLRMLRENRVPVRQYERCTFLIEGEIPDGVLADFEQTFHLILAHIYGRMVHPGDTIMLHGEEHTVPSLTMTLSKKVVQRASKLRN